VALEQQETNITNTQQQYNKKNIKIPPGQRIRWTMCHCVTRR